MNINRVFRAAPGKASGSANDRHWCRLAVSGHWPSTTGSVSCACADWTSSPWLAERVTAGGGPPQLAESAPSRARSFTRLQWISRVISNRLHQSYSRRLEKIWPSLTSLACTVCLTSSLIYLKHFQTKMQLYLGLNFGTFEALFQKSKLLCVLYPPKFWLKVPLSFWIWSSCPPPFSTQNSKQC